MYILNSKMCSVFVVWLFYPETVVTYRILKTSVEGSEIYITEIESSAKYCNFYYYEMTVEMKNWIRTACM